LDKKAEENRIPKNPEDVMVVILALGAVGYYALDPSQTEK